MAKKVAFLDRDGTINVDHGFVYNIEDWEWAPGAIEGLKLFQEAGFALAIITNQSGIARQYYTEQDMHNLHKYIRQELENQGVVLASIAFCPHDRDSTCDCRKPKTGMAKQIGAEVGGIDYANSITVGDKVADLMFGKALGTKTALVRSRYWSAEELPQQPDVIVDSLAQAAEYFIN